MNAPTPTDTVELELALEGMTCAACAARTEKSLNSLDGVRASVNFASETAQVALHPQGAVTVEELVDAVPGPNHVHYDPARTGIPALRKAVEDAG